MDTREIKVGAHVIYTCKPSCHKAIIARYPAYGYLHSVVTIEFINLKPDTPGWPLTINERNKSGIEQKYSGYFYDADLDSLKIEKLEKLKLRDIL